MKIELRKNKKRYVLWTIVLSVIGFVVVSVFTASPGASEVIAVFQNSEGNSTVELSLKLARTRAERKQGLMYVKSLGEHEGMLFIFPEESDRSFWMKNTYIPLDMVFINSQKKVVGIVHEAVPFSSESRMVGAPSKFVVEINGGLARKFGITIGSTFLLREDSKL